MNDLSQGVPHNRPGVALLLKDLWGGSVADDKEQGGGREKSIR